MADKKETPRVSQVSKLGRRKLFQVAGASAAGVALLAGVNSLGHPDPKRDISTPPAAGPFLDALAKVFAEHREEAKKYVLARGVTGPDNVRKVRGTLRSFQIDLEEGSSCCVWGWDPFQNRFYCMGTC